jgi:malic enzyme
MTNQRDLSLAYPPGVAAACLVIRDGRVRPASCPTE